MIQILHSNYQPYVFDNNVNNYTLVDYSKDRKKQYYRIEESRLPILEQIQKLAWAFFKIILTLGFILKFSPDVRSQWREGIWNKREIIILREGALPLSPLANHYNQEELRTINHPPEVRTIN